MLQVRSCRDEEDKRLIKPRRGSPEASLLVLRRPRREDVMELLLMSRLRVNLRLPRPMTSCVPFRDATSAHGCCKSSPPPSACPSPASTEFSSSDEETSTSAATQKPHTTSTSCLAPASIPQTRSAHHQQSRMQKPFELLLMMLGWR